MLVYSELNSNHPNTRLLLECYKTSFDDINFLKWKKAAPANRVAFLALTTFKLKNMEIMQ